MEYRIEKDTLGEMQVPADRLWGAQTQRSLENFRVGKKMPLEIIKAFAYLKKASAYANNSLGILGNRKAAYIIAVSDEIISGKHDEEFPLVVYQTGSGTQTNMNVNEVIANRAAEMYGKKILHPNDDVNMSQSSNDTFPTAMSIAAVMSLEDKLLPALNEMIESLNKLEKENVETIKSGRTHLMDAVPMTFGQEVSGWRSMLIHDKLFIKSVIPSLKEIALGGTAVGTGLNAPDGFDTGVAEFISDFTGRKFVSAHNKFHALSSKDAFVYAHGALKALATDLMKIANDIRWLSGGPRCGLGEIEVPANEPGSSIMPGKVNPTQAESAIMVAVRVMANDVAVGIASSQGNFELNVCMPVIADAFLESSNLLAESLTSFNVNCVSGIKVNKEKMAHYAETSLMAAAALNTHIGYETAAKVAYKAHTEGITLREAGKALDVFTEQEYDDWVDLKAMAGVK